MADLIDFERGQAAFAYQGSPAWHSLGKPLSVEARRNFRLAMAEAQTDFLVTTETLWRKTGIDEYIEVPDAQGVYRTDTGTYLATVGSSYHPIQNQDALAVAEGLIEMGCEIDVMGSIRQGRKVWMLLRMPSARVNVAGDAVDGYLCASTGHDGKSAASAILTTIRVVCDNTMRLMESLDAAKSTVVRIPHTKNGTENLRIARGTLDRMMEGMESVGATFRDLAQREMKREEIRDFIISLFPMPKDNDDSKAVEKRRITVADLIFNGKGNEKHSDLSLGVASAWAVLNGVTEYIDHWKPREKKTLSAQRKAMESSFFGTNELIKNRAFSMLRQLV